MNYYPKLHLPLQEQVPHKLGSTVVVAVVVASVVLDVLLGVVLITMRLLSLVLHRELLSRKTIAIETRRRSLTIFKFLWTLFNSRLHQV